MAAVNALKSGSARRTSLSDRGIPAVFFRSAAEFRRWLARHHATRTEVWIGFHKKGTGPAHLGYPGAVDVALCFGWIDGVRKKLDHTTYTNRFTPRKPGSIWSRINIARVECLMASGHMQQAGLDAYARRDAARSGVYSFEQRPETFPAALERRFRARRRAWTDFNRQPPGYRRLAIWWVSSAKREETRVRRLEQLIAASADGNRLGVLFGQTGSVPPPSRRARR